MTKSNTNKKHKSHLSEEDKKMGKTHVYILISMIVVSIAVALYHMN